MKQISNYFFNTTLYKAVCICAFMLVPSLVFCFFPQVVSIILLLWGALLLLRDMKYRNFAKQTGSVFLLLFCLGYVVTLVLYAENDLVSTIHIFCWAIIEFFLLFAVDRDRDTSPNALLGEMFCINAAVSMVGLLSGLASLTFFFMKISVVMPDPEGLNAFWSMGIVNGRNSGIFNNAIPCANAMFVGCAAALFNLLHDKEKSVVQSILYTVTIVVCYLVILTTLTRTYIYGVYIFVFVATFAAGYQRIKGDTALVIKKIVTVLVIAVLSVVLLIGGTEVSKKIMEKAVANVPVNSIVLNVEGFNKNTTDGTTEIEATEVTTEATTKATLSEEELMDQISDKLGLGAEITMERNELGRLPSFLYPRDELWAVALEVIPYSPVFGFTSGNRNSSSTQYSTSEYLVKNWSNGIPTYHNAYFDIAVSAGLLGLGLLLVFLGIQIFRTLRTIFTKELDVRNKRGKLAFGVLVSYLAIHVFVTSMFFGVLCFSNVSVCLYFWIAMGYVSRINDQCDDGTSKLSTNAIVENMLKLKGTKNER